MVISHKHRFVLFSPWKTASSTLHATLSQHNESAYPRLFYFNQYLNRVVTQHITAAEFLALPEGQLSYLKASFVRNPYDRAYSGFLQLQYDICHHPKVQFESQWVKELVKSQLVENQKRLIEAEYDFNKWILSLPEYEILEVGRNTSMPLHPSHYWTHICGNPCVDFTGKVEDFELDLQRFCAHVNIEYPSIKLQNVRYSPKLDEVGGRKYRYLSQMSSLAISRINETFRDDFNFFNYPMISPK
jgi:Sulfotransferase family